MPTPLDTQWHSLAFAALILRQILDNPIENETPQSRLKQIGMMSVLYYMHQGNQRLTLSNIMELTALTRGGVSETVDQLVARKLLTETLTTNAMGRGRAREFRIAPSIFENLRALQGG
ncbi:MarR family transcriptional regulator [Xanthobacter sp. KR7-65]|uniref:MarR family transcriptional regulator n=1 Tax=Xanthobacter sp. KR7-65 TaxID=3156612 RepID=UPI0032B3A57E